MPHQYFLKVINLRIIKKQACQHDACMKNYLEGQETSTIEKIFRFIENAQKIESDCFFSFLTQF